MADVNPNARRIRKLDQTVKLLLARILGMKNLGSLPALLPFLLNALMVVGHSTAIKAWRLEFAQGQSQTRRGANLC